MSDESEREIFFSMDASTKGMFFVNGCVYIIGGLIIAVLAMARGFFSIPAFLVMLAIFAAYMIIDHRVWLRNGIRRVEVDESGITFYRGKEKKVQRIENSRITGVNVFGKLNRRVVNIFTGGGAVKPVPGITLFSGPRVHITNDLFNDDEFKLFMLIILRFEHGYK